MRRISYNAAGVADITGLTTGDVWAAIEAGDLAAHWVENVPLVLPEDVDRFTDLRGLPRVEHR